MKMIYTAALAMTLVGCAAPVQVRPDPVPRPAFPVAEYEALPKTGTATITGQAFLKTRGGDVKVGAGEPIWVFPVTSYSTFSYEKKYQQGLEIGAADPRHSEYSRELISDASGRFTFRDLPPGDYYVIGRVKWQSPLQGQLIENGGSIIKRVTVKNGEVAEVMLTR